MDPARYDANVHPAKTEVRFIDERFIHDSLYRAVKDGLFAPAHVPKFQLVQGRKVISGSAGFSPSSTQLALEIQRPLLGSSTERTDRDVPSLWQIHNRYILSQIKSGLTIIDQHVAHERILYERALRFRETRDAASQQLLFPQTVTLSVQDYLTLTDMMPYLVKIGFDIKEFGKNTVVIEAVPMEIKTGQEAQVLTEMIEAYREYSDETNDSWDAVAKSFACKSAIKSGDKLSQQEMASLIDQLFATNEPYLCPHGRPIVVNLSLEEIDKRFGR
jgi:DNA mismatch repair protein MutL